MPDQVWYRSLYWRIALGFVCLVAALLVVQGIVFLWLTGRTAELLPGRSPAEFAQSIASDLSDALTGREDLDIDVYLNGRYTSAFRPFVVVTHDGRTILSRRIPPPPDAVRAAFGRLFGGRGLPDRPWPGRGGPDRGGGRGRGGSFDRSGGSIGFDPGRGGYGRGGGPGAGPSFEFGQVTVAGAPFGVVAVPVQAPPWSIVMRNLGPTLASVALGLLIVGTAVAALVVFRPTHRRLHALQQAVRAIGAGQTGVRAPVTGGDEVAALARTFNEMATDLEQRGADLALADRTRRQLLADISHELATPLAAIRGYVETLSMPGLRLDESKRTRYLQIVTDESERLEHIIGDLLDLARLEGGGGAFKIEPVDMALLFERLHHRHEPALCERDITLETVRAPGTALVGDANRLEQALQNLVSNAIRHTPSGGRIMVRAEPADGGVRVTVEDTGPGIPPEHLPRIFDRFYKADESRTGTTTPSGSGLGLSIVRAIVERHGGRITASNAPDAGARFEIVLPAAA